jgi:exodeoxyribonuclease VII small subunit
MSVKKINFESAMSKLEKIVVELESDGLSLEDALKTYEEGVKLARYCANYLDTVEKKIEKLTKTAGGDQILRPWDIDKEAD